MGGSDDEGSEPPLRITEWGYGALSKMPGIDASRLPGFAIQVARAPRTAAAASIASAAACAALAAAAPSLEVLAVAAKLNRPVGMWMDASDAVKGKGGRGSFEQDGDRVDLTKPKNAFPSKIRTAGSAVASAASAPPPKHGAGVGTASGSGASHQAVVRAPRDIASVAGASAREGSTVLFGRSRKARSGAPSAPGKHSARDGSDRGATAAQLHNSPKTKCNKAGAGGSDGPAHGAGDEDVAAMKLQSGSKGKSHHKAGSASGGPKCLPARSGGGDEDAPGVKAHSTSRDTSAGGSLKSVRGSFLETAPTATTDVAVAPAEVVVATGSKAKKPHTSAPISGGSGGNGRAADSARVLHAGRATAVEAPVQLSKVATGAGIVCAAPRAVPETHAQAVLVETPGVPAFVKRRWCTAVSVKLLGLLLLGGEVNLDVAVSYCSQFRTVAERNVVRAGLDNLVDAGHIRAVQSGTFVITDKGCVHIMKAKCTDRSLVPEAAKRAWQNRLTVIGPTEGDDSDDAMSRVGDTVADAPVGTVVAAGGFSGGGGGGAAPFAALKQAHDVVFGAGASSAALWHRPATPPPPRVERPTFELAQWMPRVRPRCAQVDSSEAWDVAAVSVLSDLSAVHVDNVARLLASRFASRHSGALLGARRVAFAFDAKARAALASLVSSIAAPLDAVDLRRRVARLGEIDDEGAHCFVTEAHGLVRAAQEMCSWAADAVDTLSGTALLPLQSGAGCKMVHVEVDRVDELFRRSGCISADAPPDVLRLRDRLADAYDCTSRWRLCAYRALNPAAGGQLATLAELDEAVASLPTLVSEAQHVDDVKGVLAAATDLQRRLASALLIREPLSSLVPLAAEAAALRVNLPEAARVRRRVASLTWAAEYSAAWPQAPDNRMNGKQLAELESMLHRGIAAVGDTARYAADVLESTRIITTLRGVLWPNRARQLVALVKKSQMDAALTRVSLAEVTTMMNEAPLGRDPVVFGLLEKCIHELSARPVCSGAPVASSPADALLVFVNDPSARYGRAAASVTAVGVAAAALAAAAASAPAPPATVVRGGLRDASRAWAAPSVGAFGVAMDKRTAAQTAGSGTTGAPEVISGAAHGATARKRARSPSRSLSPRHRARLASPRRDLRPWSRSPSASRDRSSRRHRGSRSRSRSRSRSNRRAHVPRRPHRRSPSPFVPVAPGAPPPRCGGAKVVERMQFRQSAFPWDPQASAREPAVPAPVERSSWGPPLQPTHVAAAAPAHVASIVAAAPVRAAPVRAAVAELPCGGAPGGDASAATPRAPARSNKAGEASEQHWGAWTIVPLAARPGTTIAVQFISGDKTSLSTDSAQVLDVCTLRYRRVELTGRVLCRLCARFPHAMHTPPLPLRCSRWRSMPWPHFRFSVQFLVCSIRHLCRCSASTAQRCVRLRVLFEFVCASCCVACARVWRATPWLPFLQPARTNQIEVLVFHITQFGVVPGIVVPAGVDYVGIVVRDKASPAARGVLRWRIIVFPLPRRMPRTS